MSIITEVYNKEIHLSFIESLLYLDQAPVFVNNVVDEVMNNKHCAHDTLIYLYEELVKARKEIEKLKEGK